VQKYCSLTNHVWDAYWILGNRKAVERLPKDIQEIVVREFDKLRQRRARRHGCPEQVAARRPAGQGPAVRRRGQEGVQGALGKTTFYKDWRGKFGDDAWKLLEESAGSLA
jgi:TRAP-type C4-dicarboxylate transport system substrate-binding protein